jgi:hypothetical protein
MSDATQGGLLFAVILLAYFVPTAIALLRHHQNRWPITILNFFLGWTVIGWVVMLAWAFSSKVTTVRNTS